MADMTTRDCIHGQLARKCLTCEYEAEIKRLRDLLIECVPYLESRRQLHPDDDDVIKLMVEVDEELGTRNEDALPMYGHFLGGDPRCFRPDPDGLMPSEFEEWKKACETAESGQGRDLDGAGQWLAGQNATLHVTYTMFGLGTTEKEPGPWREWAETIAKDMET